MLDGRSILIVDRDHALRRRVAAELTFGGGFAVRQAATLGDANDHIFGGGSDCSAIILDTHLPDGSGKEYCGHLRRRGLMTPIILVSVPSDPDDVVHSLEAGASDYVLKPLRMAELCARVRAQLRIFGFSDRATFPVGEFVFHPTANLLIHPTTQQRIKLTGLEAAILKVLSRAGGLRVNRTRLIEEVWGHDAVGADHALDTNLWRLRRKIENDPSRPCLLVTESRSYRLRDAAGRPAAIGSRPEQDPAP